ncbi:MAG: HNH endonuclease family protein [Candidatus Electronema sp. V4]|uniref:HNH endonuclease family protein n=1 Tax=Candidatus Electronema sp. V4 TaxID=3454756 RepID=UPI0040558D61
MFTRILRAVAIVSFRYNVICNLQTNDQERLYNEIARNFSDRKYASPADLLAALGAVYPDDSRFKTAFAEKELRTTDSSNKKVVRWILFEIERQQHQQCFDFESATYSIEHILPEHPSEDWALIDEAKQERMKYRLGNMTPLETSRNRDVRNKDYPVKRAVYQSSAFKMTQAVAEHYDRWDEQKAAARQKLMADIAAGIWRFDF